jgi:signal transduction histidine kinase
MSIAIRTWWSFVCSALLVAVGTTVIVGWAYDIEPFKAVWANISMKANTALCLFAAGISLNAVRARGFVAALGRVAAAFAGIVALATLSEHAIGWNLGIDELLFRDDPDATATASPGRMGLHASTSLTLGSIALLNLYRGSVRGAALAQLLGAAIVALALVPIVGYMYGAEQLYALARYTGIALHTALAMLVLGLGVLLARSDVGPVAPLTAATPHASMARRLLVPALVTPILFCYMRVQGERQGLYDVGLGSALVAVTIILVLTGAIWRNTVVTTRREREIERERDALLQRERAAREAAEQAGRTKDEFIATLSHELRTPLNAILGWLHLLQANVVSEARRVQATDVVARNAGVLRGLVEDLLDISRMNAGHLEIARDPVVVASVIDAAVDVVMPLAADKNIQLDVTVAPNLPTVTGDAPRLQQVLVNLLTNAIKFSQDHGAVGVTVAAAGDHVRIEVADSGEGIDPDFLPHLFERFRQGDSSLTRPHGGLGLGLAIAKHLAELHGGTITSASEGKGRGATFTLELPVAVGSGAGLPTEALHGRSRF